MSNCPTFPSPEWWKGHLSAAPTGKMKIFIDKFMAGFAEDYRELMQNRLIARINALKEENERLDKKICTEHAQPFISDSLCKQVEKNERDLFLLEALLDTADYIISEVKK